MLQDGGEGLGRKFVGRRRRKEERMRKVIELEGRDSQTDRQTERGEMKKGREREREGGGGVYNGWEAKKKKEQE